MKSAHLIDGDRLQDRIIELENRVFADTELFKTEKLVALGITKLSVAGFKKLHSAQQYLEHLSFLIRNSASFSVL